MARFSGASGAGGGGNDIEISDTAPDPDTYSQGDFWFDLNTSNLYVLYESADNKSWIQMVSYRAAD